MAENLATFEELPSELAEHLQQMPSLKFVSTQPPLQMSAKYFHTRQFQTPTTRHYRLSHTTCS